jgi:T5SS/PEP-CTERM-associated repeat protein
MCVVICTLANGQVNSWTNNAGDKWETGSDWSLGIAPGSGQSIFVTNANIKTVLIDTITSVSFPATMTIADVTVSAPSNSLNTLSLLNAGSATPLNCGQSVTVGAGGAIAVMGASLTVTNAAGTGILTVGASGEGTLALNGGSVIADQFVATSNALLFVNYGTLTTLHGCLVDVPSSFQIGNTSSQLATWNVLGGTNLLLLNSSFSTPPEFSIGAGSSPGIVVISGPGTVLTNTSGIQIGGGGASGSSLVITNGANVQTTGAYDDVYGNNSIVVVGQGSRLDSGTSIDVEGANGRLWILDGAQVTSAYGNVAEEATYDQGDVITVSGSNSTWRINGGLSFGSEGSYNTLIISNGGAMVCNGTTINMYNRFQSNKIVVTGVGSSWIDQGWTYVVNGSNFDMIVEGGAYVSSSYFSGESGFGQISVNGSGSVWTVSRYIQLDSQKLLTVTNGGVVNCGSNVNLGGPNAGSQLILTNAGILVTPYLNVGGIGAGFPPKYSNSLVVDGSDLIVTNAGANAALVIHNGALTVNGGTIMVDNLLINNGSQSTVLFLAGAIDSKGSTIADSNQFVVGDGTHTTTYNLVGGVHSFMNGLQISANAILTGCGTIIGNVNNFGTLAVTCPGGTLTLAGIVTNSATIMATNGGDIEFLGPVVNNGTIDFVNGFGHFLGGFINNGVYRDAATALKTPNLSFSGFDSVISFGCVSGKTYAVEYTDDLVSSNWLTLVGDVLGNGGNTQFTDIGAANLTQRFYRVHLFLP